MKAMKLSLAHFQDQVEHYKDRYEELPDALKKMGPKYKSRHKRQQREQQNQDIINEMMGRDGEAPPQHEEAYVGYTAPPRPRTTDTELDDNDALDGEDYGPGDDTNDSAYSPDNQGEPHDDENVEAREAGEPADPPTDQ
eukprot:TRINITY_DN45874_c0_g1_i1.p1 TRINITY_DN45874_c0_g1~~TRINITY_DN45874_c0_g1_i1.p1  ORF type:complete len:139 (-),score=12.27 TRINITY_DN45874_c0_g1_i1:29-445(-)